MTIGNYIRVFSFMLAAGLLSACGHKTSEPAPRSSNIQRQSCSDDLGFSGKWRLVSITDSGRMKKPSKLDTLVVSDCSTIERYSGGQLASKLEFKLYKMTNYCADFQLVYKNDSISCINLYKDTLVLSECSDFESTRFFYKRIPQ